MSAKHGLQKQALPALEKAVHRDVGDLEKLLSEITTHLKRAETKDEKKRKEQLKEALKHFERGQRLVKQLHNLEYHESEVRRQAKKQVISVLNEAHDIVEKKY